MGITRRWHTAVFAVWLAFFAPLALTIAKAEESAQPAVAQPARGADIYLLRGIANVFSRGLDKIGADLNAQGVKAIVMGHIGWRGATRDIIQSQKANGPRPVVLVGHSLGANAILRMARRLRDQGIDVDYMATFAATNPPPVASNVRKVTNFYFETSGWGKALKGGPGFRGTIDNVDFSQDPSIRHFNVEKQPQLQQRVIAEILAAIGRGS